MSPWKHFQMDSMTAGTVLSNVAKCSKLPQYLKRTCHRSKYATGHWSLILVSIADTLWTQGPYSQWESLYLWTRQTGRQENENIVFILAIISALILPPSDPPRNRRVSTVLLYSWWLWFLPFAPTYQFPMAIWRSLKSLHFLQDHNFRFCFNWLNW